MLLSITPGRKSCKKDTGYSNRVVERMIRRLLSGTLLSTAPRANDDEHTTSSRYSLSSFTSANLHLTSSPLKSSRHSMNTQPATTNDDTRAPSKSIMPALLSQEKHQTDPTIADTWSLQEDARLNREYTLISNDPTNE
jgi:hypothetical protein